MSGLATFHLLPQQFTDKERPLAEQDEFKVSAFRHDSGVCALRLKNAAGDVILLPFHGQQVWSAAFGGRELAMKSMFPEPRDTRVYLENYGAFVVHCGANAMGVPGPQDHHPLHGELPHAPYQSAYVSFGVDEVGPFVGVGGAYQHTIAFGTNYVAEPLVKLHAGSSLLHIRMSITNLARTEMEYMYMAHVNFRPVNNGRLVYSAHATPEHVRIRKGAPHLKSKPGYLEFLEELGKHPERHHVLAPGAPYDPEAVFGIDYLSNADGWAHSLQVHPDGSADYIRHRPDQLPKAVRWVSRTPDQDALGIILPATAEAEGYTAEKAKGNIKVLPPKGKFVADIVAGAVDAAEASRIEAAINRIVAG